MLTFIFQNLLNNQRERDENTNLITPSPRLQSRRFADHDDINSSSFGQNNRQITDNNKYTEPSLYISASGNPTGIRPTVVYKMHVCMNVPVREYMYA